MPDEKDYIDIKPLVQKQKSENEVVISDVSKKSLLICNIITNLLKRNDINPSNITIKFKNKKELLQCVDLLKKEFKTHVIAKNILILKNSNEICFRM